MRELKTGRRVLSTHSGPVGVTTKVLTIHTGRAHHGAMEDDIRGKLQPLLVQATIATGHAEELRAHTEDHASVLPKDFAHNLEALVDELYDLRDAIHDAGLDPHDDLAVPRRQRPRDERPPAKPVDLPIRPEDK